MNYCFINLRPASEGLGWEPDFPERINFLLLADCSTTKWGLYEFFHNDVNEDWRPLSRISDKLEALIESGKKYPPALAIARDKISHEFNKREPTQQEFSIAFAKSLTSELSKQSVARYFLAKALNDEVGYLCKGEWYWILGISQSNSAVVRWVSSDFFIYENPISDFSCTKSQLQNLND